MLGLLPLAVPLLWASLAACKSLKLKPEKAERPLIVYGVMTNGLPEYREKLVSQVETWAAGLVEQHRFFAVAGAGCPEFNAAGLIVEDRCDDGRNGLSCKEERLMEEGYDRDPDWFVVLGEDNYVHLQRFEDAIRNHSVSEGDSAVPTVLGVLGCGMGLNYCLEVSQLGGLCGGGTYALNKAALKALMAEGKEALREEYTAKSIPGDMASACALRTRGVTFKAMDGLVGNRIVKEADFQNTLKGNFLTLHYCTANIMRWVHATMQNQPAAEVSNLEAAAFDGGCCCTWQDDDLQTCKEEVRKINSFWQMPVAAKLPDWHKLALKYVKERDKQLAAGL